MWDESSDEAILSATLSYCDWEDGEVTPHSCGVFIVQN
jgi:hypothetical protein